ncbi:MAG: class A beta-lactamase-related serine hydrolase [Crocinitomicaceae bacterium]|nr:class A beta-lactamase-related serine hydrolase [Crocinitomicaceae bacterium]
MKKYFFLFHIVLLSIVVSAQTEKSAELYKTIKTKDSLLFNLGFNNCDLSQFENLVSENFEFYHDQLGITDSKSAFINNIQNELCKLNYKPKRMLIENSVEVYPLKNNGILYGAMENGIHHFYAMEKDSTEHLTSIAKFSHLWILENGNWKLNKALSYDHKDFYKPINNELLFKEQRETEKWLKQKSIPALGIGYIENGKIEQISVFGELENGKQAPQNTIWNVASLTKPIVTLITLKLVSNGTWNLDEPIYHYWIDPDVKNDDRNKTLTTRHILSHQTGFSNWRWLDEESQNKLTFHFDPGTNYQYSGKGYEYLKKALENKFKIPLEKLADSLIFKPLKMKDTRFYWDKKSDESRFAKWHTSDGALYDTHKNNDASAADDLLTTIEDYCQFILYVLNGAELSKSLQKEMLTEQIRMNSSKYWGLGFWIDENINDNGDLAIVHGGDDIGVHTIAFMLPKTEQGLIIFTNSDNGTEAFQQVVLKYLGESGQGIIKAEMK